MPQQEPVESIGPSHRLSTDDYAAARGATDQAGYEPLDSEDWMEGPERQLPRRPRRRLLGAGASPIPVALLGVLLTACGFIGGVLVEKGEGSSSSSAASGAGLASRFRALREGGGADAATGSSGSSPGTSARGESLTGLGRPTVGTVAFLAGSTLYVTTTEGNTVKVATSRATTVTKSVRTSVESIHPGETVTVSGTTGSNGTVSAEAVFAGSGAESGLAALLGAGIGAAGRAGAGRGGGTGGGKAGGGAAGGQPLFGG